MNAQQLFRALLARGEFKKEHGWEGQPIGFCSESGLTP